MKIHLPRCVAVGIVSLLIVIVFWSLAGVVWYLTTGSWAVINLLQSTGAFALGFAFIITIMVACSRRQSQSPYP